MFLMVAVPPQLSTPMLKVDKEVARLQERVFETSFTVVVIDEPCLVIVTLYQLLTDNPYPLWEVLEPFT